MSSKKETNTLKHHAIQIEIQHHLSLTMKIIEVVWEKNLLHEMMSIVGRQLSMNLCIHT
jgi:hypothetical protein